MKKITKKTVSQLRFPTAPRALDARELRAATGGTDRTITPCYNPRGVVPCFLAPCFIVPCFNPAGRH